VWLDRTEHELTIRQIKYFCSVRLLLLNVSLGTYSSDLKKMVYLQNRRYLPPTSSLRKRKRGFPSQEAELESPPAKRKFVDLTEYHNAVDMATNRYTHVYYIITQHFYESVNVYL
jgi:hypothetical protein